MRSFINEIVAKHGEEIEDATVFSTHKGATTATTRTIDPKSGKRVQKINVYPEQQ